jgi:hypothetical protein
VDSKLDADSKHDDKTGYFKMRNTYTAVSCNNMGHDFQNDGITRSNRNIPRYTSSVDEVLRSPEELRIVNASDKQPRIRNGIEPGLGRECL